MTWATLHENYLKTNMAGETKSKVNHSLEEEGQKYCNEQVFVSGLLSTNLKWEAVTGID